jgi:hypothetical protein
VIVSNAGPAEVIFAAVMNILDAYLVVLVFLEQQVIVALELDRLARKADTAALELLFMHKD